MIEITNFTQRDMLAKLHEMVINFDEDALWVDGVISDEEKHQLEKILSLCHVRINKAMKKFDLKQLK